MTSSETNSPLTKVFDPVIAIETQTPHLVRTCENTCISPSPIKLNCCINMASYLVPMYNIYKINLFNPDIALFAVQNVGLNGGRLGQV